MSLDKYLKQIAEEMPNPIILDNGNHREMTKTEKAEWYLNSASGALLAEQTENEKAQKATAKAALLERLGITADEAALLLS